MICARCDMPLRAGDDYDETSVDGATGAGVTIYRHRQPCRRTQQQTAPAPATGSRRRW
ncbi:hypothetical protein MQE23_08290 [Streptomyces sp. HP-A2021]|uniref:hypothetical protein n=1 Tax=Streptomyces sp. HP-A2021 TaxID=2927875 RepID=UPI001FAEF37A|nr:hypothetical protein [Streptomyces sp. HP-A2021]UOB09049.1 hypothetical protein MQE23_08290 [Streptomyces sp. HP-A2021]